MKSPSRSISDSIRGQSISTSGPGPKETGRIKQGMSAGVWPGTRLAGKQPPGTRCDNSAESFAGPLGSKAGG
jgi:hypothetical protein